MRQALYRKYRSRTLSDVVGQEHITKTLANAFKAGRLSHAYLFSGPRGVGKTSVARILAHQVNNLTYQDDAAHLDIIEIDAASNRRIDEIRDLRQKVHTTPTLAKYKVYIIDEVHMLTREAFNALLKTLEEPPAHCIFILATTEPHKLPETIISRTQRFSFKPVHGPKAVARLREIAKQEAIAIEEPALELISEYGEGSFRDSLSMLDQLSSLNKKITDSLVRDSLGLPATKSLHQLLSYIDQGDTTAAFKLLEALHEQAVNPLAIAKQISAGVRADIVKNQLVKPYLAKLLKDLLEVSQSPAPQQTLELSILEAASSGQSSVQIAPKVKAGFKTPQKNVPDQKEEIKKISPTTKAETEIPPAPADNSRASQTVAFNLGSWPEVINRVKLQAPALYSALRLATPVFSGTKLTLAFQFSLHQKKVNKAPHLNLITKIIEELSGTAWRLNCIVDKKLAGKPPAPKKTIIKNHNQASASHHQLQSITSIFGAAEVLET